MRALIIICILFQVLHANANWTPKTNSAKEGDDPAYGSKTYPLADLLFEVPKRSSGWLPKDAAVVSAKCRQLGEFKGHKIIQASLSLSNCGYSELLLILCSDSDGFRVVLASFQDRASQYYEVLSAENVGDQFVVQTKYMIPGTSPYSSEGPIVIEKKGGELSMR